MVPQILAHASVKNISMVLSTTIRAFLMQPCSSHHATDLSLGITVYTTEMIFGPITLVEATGNASCIPGWERSSQCLPGCSCCAQVFRASALVMADLRVLREPGFVGVSVTAERWMPLVQVSERELLPWLENKQLQGYRCAAAKLPSNIRNSCKGNFLELLKSLSDDEAAAACLHAVLQKESWCCSCSCLCCPWYRIIGLEQSIGSKPLPEFKFPEKSVLVLGRETTGIPPHIFQVLDCCLEIPQLGIVRSLNVHVSGALAVYEYTRQQKWAHHTGS